MANIHSTMVEVCVWAMSKDQPIYLLLRRRDDERVYPGIWQYVTGSIEAGEKADEAAIRELREETDFEPIHFWCVPHINSFYDPSHDSVNLMPLFAAQVREGIPPKLSAEHAEYRWLEFTEARRRLVWPGQREGLRIVHEYFVGGEKASNLLKLI